MNLINNNLYSNRQNNKFGVITPKQVIINNGKNQNKIYFESISRVNLIKRRVFYFNSILFTVSVLLLITLFLLNEVHLLLKIILLILSISSLAYAFIHKFYFYKIIIKLKNDKTYYIMTTQFHKNCIKEFYFSVLKRVKEDKKKISIVPLA